MESPADGADSIVRKQANGKYKYSYEEKPRCYHILAVRKQNKEIPNEDWKRVYLKVLEKAARIASCRTGKKSRAVEVEPRIRYVVEAVNSIFARKKQA